MTTSASSPWPRSPIHHVSTSTARSAAEIENTSARRRTGYRSKLIDVSAEKPFPSSEEQNKDPNRLPRAQSFRVASVQHNGHILLRPVQREAHTHSTSHSVSSPRSGAVRNPKGFRLSGASADVAVRQAQNLRVLVKDQGDVRETFLHVPIPGHKLGAPRFSARGSAFLSLASHRSSTSTKSHRGSSEWSVAQYTGKFPLPPRSSHGYPLEEDEIQENEEQWTQGSVPPPVVLPPQSLHEVHEEKPSVRSPSILTRSSRPVTGSQAFCFRPHLGVRRLFGSVRQAWRARRPHLSDFRHLRIARRTDTQGRPPSRAASITLCNFGWTKRESYQNNARQRKKGALRRSKSAPGLSLAAPVDPLSPRITSDMTMGSRSIIIMDGTDSNPTSNPTAAVSREMSPRDTYLVPPSVATVDTQTRNSQSGQMVPLFFSTPVHTSPARNSLQELNNERHFVVQGEESITTAELLAQGSMLRLSPTSLDQPIKDSYQSPGLGRKSAALSRASSYNPTTNAPNGPPRPMTTFDSYDTLKTQSRSSLAEVHYHPHGATYLDDNDSDDPETSEDSRPQRNLRRLPGGRNLRNAEHIHSLDTARASGFSDRRRSNVPGGITSQRRLIVTTEAISSPSSSNSSHLPRLNVHAVGSGSRSGQESAAKQDSFSRTADLLTYEDGSDWDPVDYASEGWSTPSISYDVAPLRVINRSQSQSPAHLLAPRPRDAPFVPERSSSHGAFVDMSSLLAPEIPQRSSSVRATSQPDLQGSAQLRRRETPPPQSREVRTNPVLQRSLSAELAAIADLPDSDDGEGGVDEALAKLEGRSSSETSPVSLGIGKAV